MATRPPALEDPGFVRFRGTRRAHAYAPKVVKALQARGRRPTAQLAAYRELLDEQGPRQPRDLLTLRPAGSRVPLDEVEPAARIVRRFVSSAMSLGALSPEAHQAISIGMARLGGSANSGEGGEDPAWYAPSADGDRRDAAIKQVASARFGVTAEYLARAEQLEIKIAQGSKPGEGGQLPGKKATAFIAGPAPRAAGHDDDQPAAAPRHLLDRGPRAAHLRPARGQPDGAHRREAGGGSGDRHDRRGRGQGACRLRHGHRALGRHGRVAAELDQARRAAVGARPGRDAPGARPQPAARPGRAAHRWRPPDRSRRRRRRHARRRGVRVRDGGAGGHRLRHGAPMPPRHLPDRHRDAAEDLRAKFTGTPEQVVAFFTALAEDVRRELAALGLRSIGEAIGRADLLAATDTVLDLAPMLAAPAWSTRRRRASEGPAALAGPAGGRLLRGRCARRPRPARDRGRAGHRSRARDDARPLDRCAAGRRAAATSRAAPAPARALRAGQGRPGRGSAPSRWPACGSRSTARPTTTSARACRARRVVVRPRTAGSRTRRWPATSASSGRPAGRSTWSGRAGMRFAVRNSGARAVVEGIGAHGCEYMTGGDGGRARSTSVPTSAPG